MMRKFPGILLFSAIEVAGLIGWLAAVDAGQRILALLILEVTFILEHIVTDNLLHERVLFNLRGLPLGQIVVFSTIETVIWAVWLLLWDVSRFAAGIFLGLGLTLEHTLSKNVHERRGLFDKIIDLTTIPHTIVEAVTAGAWLNLVRMAQPVGGAVVLLVGSVIEHTIAVTGTRTPQNER